jgi:hypothetical protein
MVMARVKPIAVNYPMFVNHFATYAVKTAQLHCSWYEEIARIDSAQKNSDTPGAYISVINELSQQLFSSLTLCIRLPQRLLASSVSNGSNPLEQFRDRVGTGNEPLQQFLRHENSDRSNWACSTTKNPVF